MGSNHPISFEVVFPRRFVGNVVFCLGFFFSLVSTANAVPFRPLMAGDFASDGGVQSKWVQVSSDWLGTPDHGLLNLADLNAALALDAGDPGLVDSWVGRVPTINHANQVYMDLWASTWSPWGTQLAPLFDPGDTYQDNYGVRFEGYINITEAGAYNFGVLADDGFSLRFSGADGDMLLFSDGLNPRERIGFAEDMLLDVGLYRFTLDSYQHLEAGIVDLGWWRYGDFEIIASSNFTQGVIPAIDEPPVLWLMVAGLSVLSLRTRLKRRSSALEA